MNKFTVTMNTKVGFEEFESEYNMVEYINNDNTVSKDFWEIWNQFSYGFSMKKEIKNAGISVKKVDDKWFLYMNNEQVVK